MPPTRQLVIRSVICVGLLAGVPPLPARAAAEPAAEPVGTGEAASRSSRLQGMVSVGRRRPVIGATVLVRRAGEDSTLHLTSSGDQGAFKVDGLPNGEYSLRITREGFDPLTKDGISLRFPFRAVVEVTMQPGQAAAAAAPPESAESNGNSRGLTVRGSVREQEGGPLGEVRLRLVRPDGSRDPRSLRSRPDGTFVFEDLAPGPWRTEIEGVGFLPLRATIELGCDTELYVSMVRQPPNYEPSPLELMPPERPTPPA